jgi:hypothetical protein
MNKAERKAMANAYVPALPATGPSPEAVFSGPWSLQASPGSKKVFITCAGHSGVIEISTDVNSGFMVRILNGHPTHPLVIAAASATYDQLETFDDDK